MPAAAELKRLRPVSGRVGINHPTNIFPIAIGTAINIDYSPLPTSHGRDDLGGYLVDRLAPSPRGLGERFLGRFAITGDESSNQVQR